MTTRSYPKRCGKCGQKTMQLATVPYTASIEHEGRTYRVELPALTLPQCTNCKALSIDDEADRQISAAFRRAARLLAPEDIRTGREKLGLTPGEFAPLLGVAEVTLARWESGAQIQERALDRFVRLCFMCPSAVELLRSDFQTAGAGRQLAGEYAIASEDIGAKT